MESISITVQPDRKGYLDRECPNENCRYTFKISMEDWKNKVSEKEVHCPLCGYIDSAEKWLTQDQIDRIHDIGKSWATNYIQQQLNKTLQSLARSTSNNKYCKMTFKPGKSVSFINNPIMQREEWETEICCENCGTHYSVIGAAYFCPCCGYNSAVVSFKDSLNSIEIMLNSLNDMKTMLTEKTDADSAATLYRKMLESSICNMVSAFQKFACCRYEELSGKTARVNDFQIVEKGSRLFEKETGKKYGDWLSANELNYLNVIFQRRHLLEHNDGMVDQRYLDNSHDDGYSVGQRIIIKNADAHSLLSILRKLGNGMLNLQIGDDSNVNN